MNFLFTLLAGFAYLAPPSLPGWGAWLFLAGPVIYALIRWRRIQPPWRGRDRLVFEVGDTGIGIAPPDLPRLFEKFYRSKQREARTQQGSGLGLAIVYSIVERHGRRVWVESEVGKGSRFYLQIPLSQPKETKPN